MSEELPHIEAIRRNRDFYERMLGIFDNALAQAVETAQEFGFDVPAAAIGVKKEPRREATGAKRGRDGKKSQAIANYLTGHDDASAADIIAALGKKGIEVSLGLISVVKKKLGKQGKPGRKKKVAEATGEKRGRKKSASALIAIIPTILAKHRSGLKLNELASAAVEAGYTYKGDKGRAGLTAIVYQTCLKLIESEGEDRVVKDPNSARYILATRAKAA
jgi:hypothetical protein